MRSLILTLSIVFLSLLAKAGPIELTFNQNGVQARGAWEQPPTTQDEGLLHLEFQDLRTHQALDPAAELEVALFMPSMGHGSAPTQIQHLGPGIFQVSNIYFLMPGEWDVRVTLRKAGGSEETQSFAVEIDGAM